MSTATRSTIQSIADNVFPEHVTRNAAPAPLYHEAIGTDHAIITSSGGIATRSGEKTGRRSNSSTTSLTCTSWMDSPAGIPTTG